MDFPNNSPAKLEIKAVNQPSIGIAAKAIIPPGNTGKILLTVLKSMRNIMPIIMCREVNSRAEFNLYGLKKMKIKTKAIRLKIPIKPTVKCFFRTE